MSAEKRTSGGLLLTAENLSEEQSKAIDFLYEHDCGLTIAPTGAGKTVIGLTAITELIADGILARVIVVAPAKVVSHWHHETRNWEHLPDNVAAGTGKQRLGEMVRSKAHILVTSYESLPVLLARDHGCDGLLLDEMTRLRASGGKTYRSLYKSIKKFTWRHGLSASPLAEDWQGVFGMAKILDLGERFGRNKQDFLDRYFISDYKGYNYDPKPQTARQLTAKMKSLVHIIGEEAKRAALGGNGVISHIVDIELPEIIVDLSRDITRDFMSDELNGVTAANAAVAVNKCRQLAQGFIYPDDGDPHILWDGRVLACQQLVSDLGRCVVVYEYQTAGNELQRALPDADRISGGMNKDEFERVMAKWRAGKGKVLLLQAKAGSHGLDGLQRSACNLVFYSPLWSNESTLQLIGRLDRTGQDRQVHVYYIVAGGIDESVMTRVEDKQQVFKDFISYLQQGAFTA